MRWIDFENKDPTRKIPGYWDTVWTKEQWKDWLKTCLLYTSPSPRDRTRSRMPSSA